MVMRNKHEFKKSANTIESSQDLFCPVGINGVILAMLACSSKGLSDILVYETVEQLHTHQPQLCFLLVSKC